MAEPFPATPREAVLGFHFADRIKAELMLASRLLNTVMHMQGQEREGASQLFLDFLRGLDQEINLAQLQIKDKEMVRVQTVMTGLLGMADSKMFADMQAHFTWMMSAMATYAQRSMEYLVREKLI